MNGPGIDDARAVEHLLYRYAELIDAGDFDGVADLFAHGSLHAVPDGPAETVFTGRDAVRALYERSTRRYEDGTPRSRHLVTNAIVEVDAAAGTAASRSVFTVLQATPSLPLQPIITGRYLDTFHRVDDAWCFATRTIHIDLSGDLSQHLLF